MHDLGISNSKRIVAGIMGAMLLGCVLFSAFFFAHEADHDCTGEDCPICACIAQCENTLHQIGEGMASQIAIELPAIMFLLLVCLSAAIIMQETPVSRKVRLNN